MSYYKQIYETKYDRQLLEKAKELTEGQGDGRISCDDVDALCKLAEDGRGLTNIEIDTLKYIYNNYKLSSDSAKIKLLEFIIK